MGKNVEYLNLSNNAISVNGSKAMVPFLKQAKGLKALLISNCGLGILGITEIAEGLKGT